MIKLWHCHNARSLRPLWAMEEMAIEFELEVLPFPPRYLEKKFLDENPLGTVPYMVMGDINMTESSAICQYLAETHRKHDFTLSIEHGEYAEYLNWLYHSDATLTFPQAIYLRYSMLEAPERRSQQVADDYRKWYLARLCRLDEHLKTRTYLCDNRFTIADITIGYALYFGHLLNFDKEYAPATRDYLSRLLERPAFKRSLAHTAHLNSDIL